MSSFHTPVLADEVLANLVIKPGHWYVDCTLGGGGHTELILQQGGNVVGIDQDSAAIEAVSQRLQSANLLVIHDNFKNLQAILTQNNITTVSGILMDLGVSSYQLDQSARGFSFRFDAPLDMRMNPLEGLPVKDLVNGLHENELVQVFERFGEERYAKRIARSIIKAREQGLIQSAKELADIIKFAVPYSNQEIHPATRVFQALRILVNDELNVLVQALPQAVAALEPGGRLVVISFHSLEDRIVKNFFKEQSALGSIEIVTQKPIIPTEVEIQDNPRARSAKMRVLIKSHLTP